MVLVKWEGSSFRFCLFLSGEDGLLPFVQGRIFLHLGHWECVCVGGSLPPFLSAVMSFTGAGRT